MIRWWVLFHKLELLLLGLGLWWWQVNIITVVVNIHFTCKMAGSICGNFCNLEFLIQDLHLILSDDILLARWQVTLEVHKTGWGDTWQLLWEPVLVEPTWILFRAYHSWTFHVLLTFLLLLSAVLLLKLTISRLLSQAKEGRVLRAVWLWLLL